MFYIKIILFLGFRQFGMYDKMLKIRKPNSSNYASSFEPPKSFLRKAAKRPTKPRAINFQNFAKPAKKPILVSTFPAILQPCQYQD